MCRYEDKLYACSERAMAANAGEKLHRVSGEAFNRARSDHEQFLEAYESELSVESKKIEQWFAFKTGWRTTLERCRAGSFAEVLLQ